MKNAAAPVLTSLLVTLASGVLAIPGTAHALTCATQEPRAPKDNDAPIPTNSLFWGYDAAFTRLLGPNGEVVPVDSRSIPVAIYGAGSPWQAYPVLVPLEELEPGARYTLEVQLPNSDPAITRVFFDTASGPTTASPAAPVLLSSQEVLGSGFNGPTRYLTLAFQHRGILIGDRGGLGAFTSIDDLFIGDTAPLPEEPLSEPGIEWMTTADTLAIGVGDCLSWPAGAGDHESARFGVLDLAGNFSGWVDTAIDLPSAEEAQAAADARTDATRNEAYAPRQERPDACALLPSRVGGTTAWLPLALGAMAAFGIRRRAAG